MKIGLISKLWETTDPKSTGGTGASVGTLANELVKRGHDVTVFGTADSKTEAKLVSVRDNPWGETGYSEAIEYLNIAGAFDLRRKFDLIHCHVEQKACYFAASSNTPSIVNIRYGQFFGDDRKVLENYKDLNYVSISNAIQELLPFLNWKGNVYNGLDIVPFEFNPKPKDYLLFLARLSPQKGPDVAIRIAKKLGKRLILAGKTVPVDKKYLEEKVFPEVDGEQIQYVGVADFNKKLELLRNAEAMLHPISFIEAFGVTLIESMACGTPVISFNNGSPREVIKDKETGFIVETEEEMLEAVKKIDTLDRLKCRQRVENNFTVKQMVDSYEMLYKKYI